MNIGISNIAWDTKDDDLIVRLLKEHAISHIDIAPTKYFQEPLKASKEEIFNIRKYWEHNNISINGMQALLFGMDLNMFAEEKVRLEMLAYLNVISKVGSQLGANKLVFGSPKNRNREGIEDSVVNKLAIDFFSRLGDIAMANGVVICLEPNPKDYNCNFLTNSTETLNMVKRINHPNILMQIDTGAIFMNNEEPQIIANIPQQFVGHIHISEAFLKPIGLQSSNHSSCSKMLMKCLADYPVTIEMAKNPADNYLDVVADSIKFTKENYN
jgi:D-psicose/D-tagatose/L-ribulose 3-epimerase